MGGATAAWLAPYAPATIALAGSYLVSLLPSAAAGAGSMMG